MFTGFGSPILSEIPLKAITKHKYSSSGQSLIEPWFQVFWNWAANYIPTFISPNLLTILGLVANLMCSIFVFVKSPDGKSEIDSFTLIFCVICIFIYQTFDALDGKHARRTNTCSPLGELLDHGCDSLSMALLSLLLFCSMKLGDKPFLMALLFLLMLTNFYIAHWQCYVNGQIVFGKIDVTESIVGVMLCLIWNAFFGSSVWMLELPVLGLELRTVASLIIMIRSLTYLKDLVDTIVEGGPGRNQTTVAETSVISPGFPFLIFLLCIFGIMYKTTQDVYIQNPCLFLLTFGFLFSKITSNLVLAHMTLQKVTTFDSSFAGPLVLLINQYFNCFLPELLCLWFSLIWCSADLFLYYAKISREIADYIGIDIFKMPGLTEKNSPSISLRKRNQ